MPADPPPTPPSNRFPKSLRLRGPGTPARFKAHFDRGHRETLHPLVALALATNAASPPPNPPPTRLGLTVPKKVGPAVLRNTIRRRLREAFRTTKPHHPPGLDVVLLVRPHEPRTTDDYRALLTKLFDRLRTRHARAPLPSFSPPRPTSAPPPPGPA